MDKEYLGSRLDKIWAEHGDSLIAEMDVRELENGELALGIVLVNGKTRILSGSELVEWIERPNFDWPDDYFAIPMNERQVQ